jgi:hypothetical protein
MVAVSYSLLNQKEEAIKWTEQEYELRCDAFGPDHPRTVRTKVSLRALKKEVYGVDEVSDTEGEEPYHFLNEETVDDYTYSASNVDPGCINWSIDPFEVDEAFTIESVLQMFHASGCVRTFNIPMNRLSRLVLAAKNGYHSANSFHNWRHAWSVTMSAYLITMSPGIVRCLGPADRLAILVAAMLHDIDHPGVNNDFLIKSADPLAIKFPTPNVLERHHWGLCEKLLMEGEPTDILLHLEEGERQRVMTTIHSGIMATDMVSIAFLVSPLSAYYLLL